MTIVEPPSILEGYFARSERFPDVDQELAFRVFAECAEDYRTHAASLRSTLDDSAERFLERYALGGFHRKSLHDEIVQELEVSFESEEKSARAAIEISLSGLPGLSSLRVEYFGLANWEVPSGKTFALISRHELLRNRDLLQHTLYRAWNQADIARVRALGVCRAMSGRRRVERSCGACP